MNCGQSLQMLLNYNRPLETLLEQGYAGLRSRQVTAAKMGRGTKLLTLKFVTKTVLIFISCTVYIQEISIRES
jgi:hypothetical protein